MAEVYIYLENEKAALAAACGIKLSDISEGIICINNMEYSFFRAFLHPEDVDHENSQRCVKLELKDRYCYVADANLYDNEEYQDMFFETIIPFSDYQLGDYENPVCIVCCSIIPGQAVIEGEKFDTPLLYENSRELYKNDLHYKILGEDNENIDFLVYLYYEDLVAKGEMSKTFLEEKILYSNIERKEFVYIERKEY